MTAYLKNVPNGIPGSISRPDYTKVEPAVLIGASGVFPTAFGVALKYVTGGVQQFLASDPITAFAGFLVREVPAVSGGLSQLFGGGVPAPDYPAGVMIAGYMSVLCTVGTPVRGGQVYVRVVAGSGKLVGDLEATADGSNNLAIPNCTWATDGVDAFLNAEIRLGR